MVQPSQSSQNMLADRGRPNEWNVYFFGCLASPGVCLEALCCPCKVHTENEELRDGHSDFQTNCLCCFFLCPWYFCITLGEDRLETIKKYNIIIDTCNMTFNTLFCFPCTLVQERRQIEYVRDHPEEFPFLLDGPPQQVMAAPQQQQGYQAQGQPMNYS